MNSQGLHTENEALHACLADACATLMLYAAQSNGEGTAAQTCLQRIRDNEPRVEW